MKSNSFYTIGLMIIEIIILFIAILLSGFFSGIESAFFSVSKLDLKRFIKERRKNAFLLKKLKDDPHRFIITDLIGNNVVNIFAASLATKIAIDMYGDAGIGIATGIMTILVLIFGEIIPKAYCANNSAKISLLATPIIYFLSIVLKPVIFVLDKITTGVLRIMGIKHQHADSLTEQNVKDIISISEEDGAINKAEGELIRNVLEFDETDVEEIMVPKESVTHAIISDKPKDVLQTMNDTGFSRIPVFDENREVIVGIVTVKDIINDLFKKKQSISIKKLIRQPLFIPESKKIHTLFSELQKKTQHMAVVVNEYGGYIGVVTMEDILEEIVGEMFDETDVEKKYITKIDKNTFIITGDCHLDDFNDALKTNLSTEEFNTINGYILKLIGRIPKKREEIQIEHLQILITKVSKSHITEMKVIKQRKL